MKLAHVGLILGTSSLASAAEMKIGDIVQFGGNTKTLTFKNDGIELSTGLYLDCVNNYAAGTAKNNYPHMQSVLGGTELTGAQLTPPTLGTYDDQTTLAFWCGVKTSANGLLSSLRDISTAPTGVLMKDGNRVLVKFNGGASCVDNSGTLTLEFQDPNNKGTLTNGVFTAAVRSKVTFGCKKAEEFTASVDAELKVKKKSAATFILADAPDLSEKLERGAEVNGGDVYQKDWTVSYDLGTTNPSSKYFTSGGCSGGGDLCFGALKTTSDASASTAAEGTSLSAASGSAGSAWQDDLVTYHKFDSATCKMDTAASVAKEASQWAVCQLTKTTGTGGDGLLTTLDCPFVEGTTISTQTELDNCEAEGRQKKVFVTCEDSSTTGYIAPYNVTLGDPDFVAKVEFSDVEGKYFKQLGQGSLHNANTTKKIQSGGALVDWALPFKISKDTNLANVKNLRVEESATASGGLNKRWEAPVAYDFTSVDDDFNYYTLRFKAPSRDIDLDLWGEGFPRCAEKTVGLTANTMQLKVEVTTQASGSFASLGACDGRFEYTPATNGTTNTTLAGMKVVSVHAPGKGASEADIQFCKDGKLTRGDCEADLPTDPQRMQGQNYALVKKLCDGTASGHVGGLVEFEDPSGSRDYYYAPVFCPGPCQQSGLKPINLDWNVDFKASPYFGLDANNKTANVLKALQSRATYDGKKDDLKRMAFLSPIDRCSADGTILGPIRPTDEDVGKVNGTGCGILQFMNASADYDARTFDTATEIQAKFQECGNTQSDNPEVYLVQHLHVDLAGDANDEYFCHSQKLKLEVKDMQNQVIAVLAQVDASSLSTAAGTISTSIGNVRYDNSECTSGGYKVIATIDVDASLVAAGVDYTETLTNPKFLPAVLSANDDLLMFKGASCVDICAAGNEQFYADEFAFKGELIETGNNATGAQLDVDFDFKIEGSPCEDKEEIKGATATLSLYGKPGIARTIQREGFDIVLPDSSAVNCKKTGNYTQLNSGEVAVGDHLCADIKIEDEAGDSSLRIIRALLTRTSPGSVPEVLAHSLFTDGETLSNDRGEGIHGTDGGFGKDADVGYALTFADAFTEYKLVVDYEQMLVQPASRRLLRSEHIFGASDLEVEAKITVLPAAAQIQDAVEGGEVVSSQDASTDTATAPSAETEETKEWYEEVWAIVMFSVGGVLILFFARSWMKFSDPLESGRRIASGDFANANRPDRKVYNKVRRSERFTISNF